jgi:hypothetical protein
VSGHNCDAEIDRHRSIERGDRVIADRSSPLLRGSYGAASQDDRDLSTVRRLADVAAIAVLQERAIRRREILTEQL